MIVQTNRITVLFIYQGSVCVYRDRVKMRDSASNRDYNDGIINIDTN